MVERRDIAIATQVFCRHTPNRLKKRNGLRLQRLNMREHAFKRLFDAVHFVGIHGKSFRLGELQKERKQEQGAQRGRPA